MFLDEPGGLVTVGGADLHLCNAAFSGGQLIRSFLLRIGGLKP